MLDEPTYFTENKVLQITDYQGYFNLNTDLSVEDDRVKTVLKLSEGGYLERTHYEDNTVTYNITESGKNYLKKLNQPSECQPKHYLHPELLEKGLELESILSKRLNTIRNANKRGLEFNLTDANMRSLLNKKHCHYTGVEFDTDDDPLNVRTLERVDDSKGYVQGNVVAVTLRANRIKNTLLEGDNELKIDVEQFIKMAEQIKKHLK